MNSYQDYLNNANSEDSFYEFCPRCEANLTLQKGYSNDLPYWVCKGCGEMLINPDVPSDSDISWICDGCGTMLNIQPGFSEDCGRWECTECGYVNKIDVSELFVSEDEYLAYINSPYRGLSDENMLELMEYREKQNLGDKDSVFLVENAEGELFVKKILSMYDSTIYRYLLDNPVPHMPRLLDVFEGQNNLVIIEEYIKGKTVSEIIKDGPIAAKEAIRIAKELLTIVKELHSSKTPIIHRDIKPSNVIVSESGDVYLLDINIAKWSNSEAKEDTRLLGTLYFAAPEQLGYGFSSSTEKADIYAMGMLLNVMVTGKLPKEERAEGALWEIIEKCICLEPSERFSDDELLNALNCIER